MAMSFGTNMTATISYFFACNASLGKQ